MELETTLCEVIEGRTRDCEKECLADIRWYDTLERFFKEVQPDVVFHLAAQPIVSEGYAFPRQTFETNVMGTVNVLECIRKTPSVKSAVIITTDKVYDDSLMPEDGYKENDPLDGFDPYSNSKSCADLATQCYTRCFLEKLHIPVTIFRAGNVIGGGDFAKNRIVPDVMRAWSEGEMLTLRNPDSVRPYQHVLEPLHAYLVYGATQGRDGLSDIYNVGPLLKDCATTRELVDLLYYSLDETTHDYKFSPSPMRESAMLTLNTEHIRENGWQPLWTIEEAADKTAQWYRCFYQGESVEATRALMGEQIEEYMAERD